MSSQSLEWPENFLSSSMKYCFAIEVLEGARNRRWLASISEWDESTAGPIGPKGEDLSDQWAEYQKKFTQRLKEIAPTMAIGALEQVATTELARRCGGYDPEGVKIVFRETFVLLPAQRILVVGVDWPISGAKIYRWINHYLPDSSFANMPDDKLRMLGFDREI
jgi:hypothetical protein